MELEGPKTRVNTENYGAVYTHGMATEDGFYNMNSD
jgi:hypothetical protein